MRNATSFNTISGLGLLALIATGCSQSQNTAYVRDDVYDRPDPRTVTAAVMAEEEAKAPAQQSDYYNPEEAQRYANPRGYYDMAYNDPYYYGYDRFGFGMSYGNQWGNSMWGSGYGYGNVWNDPFYGGYGSYGGYGGCSGGYGWNNGYGNGWNNGYGSSYYNGYGCGCGNNWNNPYNYGGYNGYGYYGYGGGCYNCYQPIVTCGGEGWGGNTYFGHRPSFGGGTNAGSTSTGTPVGPRMNNRDQAGLMKPAAGATRPLPTNTNTTRPVYTIGDRDQRTVPTPRPQERATPTPRERGGRNNTERQERNNNDAPRMIDNSRNTGGGNGGNGGNSGGRRPR